MQITALEKRLIEDHYRTYGPKNIKAHHMVHDLIWREQDDNCSVTEQTALMILTYLKDFSLIRYNNATCEYTAVVLIGPYDSEKLNVA